MLKVSMTRTLITVSGTFLFRTWPTFRALQASVVEGDRDQSLLSGVRLAMICTSSAHVNNLNNVKT